MKKIPLTQGYFAIVDDEDFEELSKFNWQLLDQGRNKYAKRTKRIGKRSENKRLEIRMHRIIMKAKNNELVDHINGNGLDNRKSNLRICNKGQNQRNTLGHSDRKSKFKGVSKLKNTKTKCWMAQIGFNYKTIYIGTYLTQKEAAIAYNEAAIKYHGEFACLNKVD